MGSTRRPLRVVFLVTAARDPPRSEQIPPLDYAGKQSAVFTVDHAAWGIQGFADRASRMASMGRRPWLWALTK